MGLTGAAWGGLAAATVAGLTASLPGPNAATAGTHLLPRLLAMPSPPGGAAELGAADRRIGALLAMGGAEEAVDQAAAAADASSVAGGRRQLEVELAAGLTRRACAQLGSLGGSEAWTAMARVACALATGDAARATVLVAVLRERRPAWWAEAEPLAEAALRGDAAAIAATDGALAGLTPGLLRTAPITSAKPTSLRPAALAALAGNPTLPPALRLEVADAATERGLASPGTLRLALLASPGEPRGAALRALRDATPGSAKVAALLAAWRLPLAVPRRLAFAAALRLEVDPALAVDPAAASAMLPLALLAGDADQAVRLAAVRLGPGPAPLAQGREAAVFTVGSPAVDRPPAGEPLEAGTGMAPWLALAGRAPEGWDGLALSARAAAALRAMGRLPADPTILAALPTGASEPSGASAADAPLLTALAAARRAGAPAAVAVLALHLLGPQPWAAEPLALEPALAALVDAGFEAEALALAAAVLLAETAPPP